ncbi:DUF1622 domain-containing protein [Deinococcus sp.]|uniref:DUF1622 domain-containing protein n=1 Tax=Deinococcus sp. TaxID=47478 RepID=UPI0025BEFCD8|nr:DUF1622 domain-containing protein [Deinococcus sp.]
MPELVKVWTEYVALGVELTAAIIIALAALVGAVRALLAFVPPRFAGNKFAGRTFSEHDAAPDVQKESLRLDLARWLAVALEFTLAADILRTAIAPSWDDIGKLAAIATLRTLLNYFLQREIDGHRARQGGSAEVGVRGVSRS